MNKRKLGSEKERLAGAYLETQGYQILEYNFRCREGEIDIVARDGRTLVFVEVKYRTDGRSGSPMEAVDARKQRKISRTAIFYLLRHGYGEAYPCRFDVVAVEGSEFLLIKNAFYYQR